MKAYKVEILVIDFEGFGPDEIKTVVKNNRHMNATVQSIDGKDIGEWSDDHPLNSYSKAGAEYKRLFGDVGPGDKPSPGQKTGLWRTRPSDSDLVRRAVENIRAPVAYDAFRWSLVANLFGVGSTAAITMCREAGLDPDEVLSGGHCEECPLAEE